MDTTTIVILSVFLSCLSIVFLVRLVQKRAYRKEQARRECVQLTTYISPSPPKGELRALEYYYEIVHKCEDYSLKPADLGFSDFDHIARCAECAMHKYIVFWRSQKITLKEPEAIEKAQKQLDELEAILARFRREILNRHSVNLVNKNFPATA